MAVTFTNIRFDLEVDYDKLEEVFRILRDMRDSGSGNRLYAEANIHVTGQNADIIIQLLGELREQGALDQYKYSQLVNHIESFKKLYLK